MANSVRYQWDMMSVGEMRVYQDCFVQSVRTSFRRFCAEFKIQWRIQIATIPDKLQHGARADLVMVTRIDDDEERRVTPIKGTIDAPPLGVHRLHGQWDSMTKNGQTFKAYLHKRTLPPAYLDLIALSETERRWFGAKIRPPRATTYGWELMELGSYVVCRMVKRDLLYRIKYACIPRGLMWKFELFRIQNPKDDADLREHWLVTRVR